MHKNLPKLYEKLSTKVGLCNQRKNLPFVVGGTRDLVQAICDAQEAPATFVCVTQSIDLEPLLSEGQCHPPSMHRYLLQKGKKVILFGVDGSRSSASKLPSQEQL